MDIEQRNSKIGRQTPRTRIDASRYQDVVVRESFRREVGRMFEVRESHRGETPYSRPWSYEGRQDGMTGRNAS